MAITNIDRKTDISWFEYREDGCPISPDCAELIIRRKGRDTDLVRNRAFEIRGNELGFRWGEGFKSLRKGRYIGTLVIDDCERCDWEFQIKEDCNISHVRNESVTINDCCEDKPKYKPADKCEDQCPSTVCLPEPECDSCAI